MANKYVKIWEAKIVEIKETGNCKNTLGEPYFSDKHKKERMILFCETMIDRLKQK